MSQTPDIQIGDTIYTEFLASSGNHRKFTGIVTFVSNDFIHAEEHGLLELKFVRDIHNFVVVNRRVTKEVCDE